MKLSIIITLVSLTFFISCKKDEKETVATDEIKNGTLQLIFQNNMTNLDGEQKELLLGDTSYKTINGDTLSFSTFKYFISNVKLINQTGDTVLVEDSYHLVASTKMMSMSTFELKIPEGNYDSIEFSLGVDSTANMDETIIKGDLDPNSNMVWNWHVGYKFLLVEGAFNHNSTDGKLLYHIGLNSNYSTYSKDLPMTLAIEYNKTSSIHIMANCDQFFGGVNTIDVETINTVKVGPANEVAKLVENYRDSVFMVHLIENVQ